MMVGYYVRNEYNRIINKRKTLSAKEKEIMKFNMKTLSKRKEDSR